MKSLYVLALTLLFYLPSLSAQAAHGDPIGIVTVAVKDVFVKHHGSEEEQKVSIYSDVYLGDTFVTKDDESFVQVDFIDKTNITMNGMDSTLTIDEYIFDPENVDNGKAKFSVLKGSFEFVGGLLDKGKEENVQIDLDFGSIGVRGTKIRRSMKNDECWIYLEDGEIRVFNDGGEVFMKPGDGTRMSAKTKAPTPAKPWSVENVKWIRSATQLPQ